MRRFFCFFSPVGSTSFSADKHLLLPSAPPPTPFPFVRLRCSCGTPPSPEALRPFRTPLPPFFMRTRLTACISEAVSEFGLSGSAFGAVGGEFGAELAVPLPVDLGPGRLLFSFTSFKYCFKSSSDWPLNGLGAYSWR